MNQNMSAVTGACMMLRKEVFAEIGGFDERLAIAFNNVNLCMRLRRKGTRMYGPLCRIDALRVRTRGPEDTVEKQSRFHEEVRRFIDTWHDELRQGESFYSPHLTLSSEDFALRLRS